jgi:hypothetical protein
MLQNEINQWVASIKIQLARRYLNDLREYFDGDEGRFSRMVVNAGQSPPTAHPQGWAQHCVNMLAYKHVPTYFAEEAQAIREQLIAWKLLT